MDLLKPTKGKIISTIIFTLLMLISTYFLEIIWGGEVNLISYTVIKWMSFVVFVFILYFLSSLIFHNFIWHKIFIFLLILIAIPLSVIPQNMYFSYLFDNANDCNNYVGGPIATSHPYRQCECLGTPIGVIGIDWSDSKCLGETGYTYTWNYLKGTDGNYYGTNAEEFRKCNLLDVSDKEKCIDEIRSVNKLMVKPIEFSSLEEWEQYCYGVNEDKLRRVCQYSLGSAREYLEVN